MIKFIIKFIENESIQEIRIPVLLLTRRVGHSFYVRNCHDKSEFLVWMQSAARSSIQSPGTEYRKKRQKAFVGSRALDDVERESLTAYYQERGVSVDCPIKKEIGCQTRSRLVGVILITKDKLPLLGQFKGQSRCETVRYYYCKQFEQRKKLVSTHCSINYSKQEDNSKFQVINESYQNMV